MKINQTNPATMHHLQMIEHYNRLLSEKRITDNLEEQRKQETVRRVQEPNKGQHVDVMV